MNQLYKIFLAVLRVRQILSNSKHREIFSTAACSTNCSIGCTMITVEGENLALNIHCTVKFGGRMAGMAE